MDDRLKALEDSVSLEDAERLTKELESFGGDELSDEERQRILSSVKRKAASGMKTTDNENKSITVEKTEKEQLTEVRRSRRGAAAAACAALLLAGAVGLGLSLKKLNTSEPAEPQESRTAQTSAAETVTVTTAAPQQPEETSADTEPAAATTTTANQTLKPETTTVQTKAQEEDPEADSEGIPYYTDVKPEKTNGEFARAVTQYTADLYRQTAVYGQLNGQGALCGKNDLISGCSAMLAFGMTANGMAGDTLSEMLGALGGISLQSLNSGVSGLMEKTQGEDQVIRIANGIWINNYVASDVKQSFLDVCSGDYKSAATYAPFNDDTKDEINSWVNQQTNGMIPDIIGEFDKGQIMALINCICFEDTWNTQFTGSSIKDGTFTKADGTEQDCKMLIGDVHGYYSNEYFEGFTKEYSDSDFYFCGMLPREGVTMEQALEGLSEESIEDMLYRSSKDVNVHFYIPEFTYDYDTSLVEEMKALGSIRAFDKVNGGDFTEMLDYYPEFETVCISTALQKTHIEFDRHGTKAAASTYVAVTKTTSANPAPELRKTLRFNRPFMYMIVYKGEDGDFPVFIGSVNEM